MGLLMIMKQKQDDWRKWNNNNIDGKNEKTITVTFKNWNKNGNIFHGNQGDSIWIQLALSSLKEQLINWIE